MDQFFPREIIQLIFAKLSLKNLMKLRCIFKLWCQIINDPEMHSKRSMEEPEFMFLIISKIIRTKQMYITSLGITSHDFSQFKLDGYKHESSCNGILYFSSVDVKDDRTAVSAYLLNPCRQEVLKLPSHHKFQSRISNRRYGLGFNWTTSKHKVVYLYGNTSTEIYTLGSKSAWRALSQESILCLARFESSFIHRVNERATYAKGVLYWANRDQPNSIYFLP